MTLMKVELKDLKSRIDILLTEELESSYEGYRRHFIFGYLIKEKLVQGKAFIDSWTNTEQDMLTLVYNHYLNLDDEQKDSEGGHLIFSLLLYLVGWNIQIEDEVPDFIKQEAESFCQSLFIEELNDLL